MTEPAGDHQVAVVVFVTVPRDVITEYRDARLAAERAVDDALGAALEDADTLTVAMRADGGRRLEFDGHPVDAAVVEVAVAAVEELGRAARNGRLTVGPHHSAFDT